MTLQRLSNHYILNCRSHVFYAKTGKIWENVFSSLSSTLPYTRHINPGTEKAYLWMHITFILYCFWPRNRRKNQIHTHMARRMNGKLMQMMSEFYAATNIWKRAIKEWHIVLCNKHKEKKRKNEKLYTWLVLV